MDIAVLRTFLAILDEGSFAAAARRMGISKSLCSKQISDLEAEIGTRLFTRTTRSVTPTSVGHAYGARIREVLRQLDDAHERIKTVADTPSGRLRIGAPIFYGLDVLQPHFIRFTETYPDIRLELILDDNRVDLIRDGFDAVIRIGVLEDSSLHARTFQQARFHVVASPGYLQRHGTPNEPQDLLQHSCLHYVNMRGTGTWPFQKGRDMVHQRVHVVFATNNPEIMRSMAVDGQGIALLPDFVVRDELESGRLVALMTEYALPSLPISVVYPSRRLMTAALRAFLEFVNALDLDEATQSARPRTGRVGRPV
jgi:DNA-binding transcriptional LysR family regulator